MANKIFQLNYAGHPVRVSFLKSATMTYIRPLPSQVYGACADISVSREQLERERVYYPEDSSDEYLEYRCLMSLVARFLLRFGCCIFHAVAFRWRDMAWLLTAPPETGKTTQYFNWRRLFPGEVTMISGDMPVLEGREDGSVWVHPSSWNGKEKLRGAEAAPLGGLVLLEQGQEDRIFPLSVHDGLLPFAQQFMVIPETEQEILSLTKLLERLLLAAPRWKMINRGGNESTILLRETLLRSLESGRSEPHDSI